MRHATSRPRSGDPHARGVRVLAAYVAALLIGGFGVTAASAQVADPAASVAPSVLIEAIADDDAAGPTALRLAESAVPGGVTVTEVAAESGAEVAAGEAILVVQEETEAGSIAATITTPVAGVLALSVGVGDVLGSGAELGTVDDAESTAAPESAPEVTAEPDDVIEPAETEAPKDETSGEGDEPAESEGTEGGAGDVSGTESDTSARPGTDLAPVESARGETAEVMPLVAGPEPGISTPYIYFEARSTATGNPLVGGASFRVAGPRFFTSWGSSVVVEDNVGQPGYTGADLDPDPGEFLIKQIGTHTISTSNRYRVQRVSAPLNHQLGSTSWVTQGGSGNSGTWNGGVWEPADFLFTPVPTGTITVNKGGLRTGGQTVAGLAGAEFEVYSGGNDSAPNTSPANLVGICTTAANGQCSVVVNSGSQYWVVEKSAPAGYYDALGTSLAPGVLRVEGSSGGASDIAYSFRTASIGTGSTTLVPATSTGNVARASGGTWANSAINPTRERQCGIRVGLLVDLSNSLVSSENDLRAAGVRFVDALAGTPSQIAVWTFAGGAPAYSASGTVNNNLPLTSVLTTAGANTVRNKVNGLTVIRTGDWRQGTNWDAGLYQVATAPAANTVDVLIVLTDGSPTYYGPAGTTGTGPDGPGGNTRFREIENAVFSANAVKVNKNTRIVAVGVGSGVSNAKGNLASISGPVEASDFYTVSSYAALEEFLQNLAFGQCEGTVNVAKMMIPPGGTAAQATPQEGWGFEASTSASGVSVSPPSGTTNAAGGISFATTGLPPDGTAPIAIVEEDRVGYTLVPQNGQNAVCTNDLSQNVPVTNNGVFGFTTQAQAGRIVNCVVYNEAPNPAVGLVVHKKWVIDGTAYDDGDQPFGQAGLQLNGAAANFGQVNQFDVGTSVAIDEVVTGLPTFCTNVPAGAGNHVMTATPNPNEVTLTNTVTCDTTLTLVKRVEGGSAQPTEWTLTATGPGGTLPGPSGTDGVTASVTPNQRYVLAESGGDSRYVQEVVPGAVPIPGSTGSWHCYVLDADGERGTEYDGLNGGVVVQTGQRVECEAVNLTAFLRVTKSVLNEHGGDAEPGDWTLTATPDATPSYTPPLTASSVPGDAGTLIQVRPGHPYAISESSVPGYEYVGLEVLVGGSYESFDGNSVTVPAGGEGIYQVVNRDLPGSVTWTKVDQMDPDGDKLGGAEWTLQGPGVAGTTVTIEDCVAAGCTGPDMDPAVGQFLIENLAWGEYVLTETKAPAGYVISGDSPWTFTIGTEAPAELDWNLGDITNYKPTGPSIPLTGGLGSDQFLIVGGALLILAAGATFILRRRRAEA